MASDPIQPPVGLPQTAPPPQPWTRYEPGMPPYAPEPTTNVMAIVALAGSFFVGIVGIVCGHIALAQIKRTGEKGRGLALAGTIIGYVQTGFVVLWTLGVVVAIVVGGITTSPSSSSGATAEAAPTSDCSTVENASLALSTALTDIAASSWEDDPATAKQAVVDATSAFEDSTSGVTDSTLSYRLNSEQMDLAKLSSAFVDYEAADAGQRDPLPVANAITTTSRDLLELTTSCR
ncbi:DUF4190 domain-containing protein [Leifsonia shinshuensis]|uniref:DUF4190 domain-containing protein n=1 Tax=Leifsonia shinshuensis TaxID=150026 RepID=UPI001F50E300|nr:DUF4190 domain-containing protein [Leifsonia shinshuensis]MCI0156593.1 DUF4190 domain-containing protein [Leifsonia shinshuensis]